MINHLRLHSTHSIFSDDTFFYSTEDQKIQSMSNSNMLFSCSMCNQTFYYKFCLENHLKAHVANNLLNCCACCGARHNEMDNNLPCRSCQVQCQGKSSQSSNYDVNAKKLRKSNNDEMKKIHTPASKPYKCALCPLSFSQKSPLKNHIMTHSDERPFACKFCGKTYKRNSELTRHTMVHTGERPHECPECQMTFRDKTQLNYHMKVHTGEKPFECVICHKTCARRCDLTSHMLLHTGGRYDCDICGKFFTRKSDLKRHNLVHTGEKPFACDFCDMAFRERARLNAHLLLHTSDKKHSCRICGETFSDKIVLRKHISLHNDKQQHQCHICGKSYKAKRTLTNHIRTHDLVYDTEPSQEDFKDEEALKIPEFVEVKEEMLANDD